MTIGLVANAAGVSVDALRFYERHGFKVVGCGFEKEWQLEDVEYEWCIS